MIYSARCLTCEHIYHFVEPKDEDGFNLSCFCGGGLVPVVMLLERQIELDKLWEGVRLRLSGGGITQSVHKKETSRACPPERRARLSQLATESWAKRKKEKNAHR